MQLSVSRSKSQDFDYGISLLRMTQLGANSFVSEQLERCIKALQRAQKREKLVTNSRDDWGTSPQIIAAVKRVAPIELDVAATDNNAKAKWFYSAEGELQNWETKEGLAWCNPPFSKKLAFAKKYAFHSKKLHRCVLLLGGTESTEASRIAYAASACVARLNRRERFEGAEHDAPFDVRLYFSRGLSADAVRKAFAGMANVEIVEG